MLILARTEQSLWPEGTFTTRVYLLLPFYIAKVYLLLLLLHSFWWVDILLLPGYICNFYSTVIIAKVQLLQYKVLNCNWKSNCSDRLKGANVCSNSLQLSNYVILWNFYCCNVAGPGFCQLHHNVYLMMIQDFARLWFHLAEHRLPILREGSSPTHISAMCSSSSSSHFETST